MTIWREDFLELTPLTQIHHWNLLLLTMHFKKEFIFQWFSIDQSILISIFHPNIFFTLVHCTIDDNYKNWTYTYQPTPKKVYLIQCIVHEDKYRNVSWGLDFISITLNTTNTLYRINFATFRYSFRLVINFRLNTNC